MIFNKLSNLKTDEAMEYNCQQTKMKKMVYALFLLFAVSLISCKQDEPNDSVSIVGHWELNYLLVNTIEDMDMQQEKVFYPGSMDVYENHTLFYSLDDSYDKNYGKWIQNGNQFIISLDVEGSGSLTKLNFKIEKLTKTELVLKRSIIDENTEIGTYDYYCVRK